MIPRQRDRVTPAARFLEPPTTTLAVHEGSPQRLILRLQLSRQLLQYTRSQRRLRACDVVFRVGARRSKIKREELEIASPAVDGNFLRFIRTFEEYIKEIRPDSTKEEVIELFRDLFSDTVNFVHQHVLQISALHIFLREV
jgi:hypothetical protein